MFFRVHIGPEKEEDEDDEEEIDFDSDQADLDDDEDEDDDDEEGWEDESEEEEEGEKRDIKFPTGLLQQLDEHTRTVSLCCLFLLYVAGRTK